MWGTLAFICVVGANLTFFVADPIACAIVHRRLMRRDGMGGDTDVHMVTTLIGLAWLLGALACAIIGWIVS
jgi:hypothetical protein